MITNLTNVLYYKQKYLIVCYWYINHINLLKQGFKIHKDPVDYRLNNEFIDKMKRMERYRLGYLIKDCITHTKKLFY